jgi:hypothetical protein
LLFALLLVAASCSATLLASFLAAAFRLLFIIFVRVTTFLGFATLGSGLIVVLVIVTVVALLVVVLDDLEVVLEG